MLAADWFQNSAMGLLVAYPDCNLGLIGSVFESKFEFLFLADGM